LLQTFADPAVIAIENARLFNELEARTAELGQLLEDLRVTQNRLVQTQKLASSIESVELTDELNDVFRQAIFP
jgi:GAF domain-containing protein